MRVVSKLLLASLLMAGSVGVAPAGAEDAGSDQPAWQGGSAEKGARVFKKCMACHVIAEQGPPRIGPNLYGVFGRKAGGGDFNRYSKAMEKAGEDGLVWGGATLYAYLENPMSYVKGTNMSFAGLRTSEDRKDVIAYLAQESGAATPIPAGTPTSAE